MDTLEKTAAFALLVSMAAGCMAGSGDDGRVTPEPVASTEAVQDAPLEEAPVQEAPVQDAQRVVEPFNPPRLRAWPKLNAWLDGDDVSREPTTGEPLMPEAQLAAQGKVLFGQYCYQCHGNSGRGDGPRSPLFEPPPRDLTQGIFKFRSTASGKLPTRTDLFRTITGGLRGTGMMTFADLPEEHRWALVEYVRTLSPGFHTQADPAPVQLGDRPDDLDAAARQTRGHAAYDRLGCASCHGVKGRGDGSSAASLLDYKGRPLAPPDFATRPAKWGGDPASLFRTLSTGMNGSAMPSYADSAKSDELWDVVSYVTQLTRDQKAKASPRERAEAEELMGVQKSQGKHAVEGGCGCAARRRKQAAAGR